MLTRSIIQKYKQIWKTALGCFLIMPLLAVASFFLKDYLTPLLEIMAVWPKEMLAFCGMTGFYSGNTGLLVFYLALIFTNMFAIAVCVNSADMMNEDEEWGVTVFYVNQPYTKTQIFAARLAGYLVLSVLKWWIYIEAAALSLQLLCRQLGVAAETELIYNMGVKGMPILLFACGLVVLYSMMPSRNMEYRDLVLVFSFLGYLFGNAYKIPEYLAYQLRTKQENAAAMEQLAEKLELFRSAYPFTVMNVLNTEKKPLPESAPAWYLLFGIFFVLLAWWLYYRKPLVEE